MHFHSTSDSADPQAQRSSAPSGLSGAPIPLPNSDRTGTPDSLASLAQRLLARLPVRPRYARATRTGWTTVQSPLTAQILAAHPAALRRPGRLDSLA